MPSLFQNIMTGIVRENKASSLEPPGSFGVVNLDISLHNVLINHVFNILAIIDLDSVVAHPNALL
jgi:hypothetical protein